MPSSHVHNLHPRVYVQLDGRERLTSVVRYYVSMITPHSIIFAAHLGTSHPTQTLLHVAASSWRHSLTWPRPAAACLLLQLQPRSVSCCMWGADA